jgi:penicillin-binding protein A
VGSGEIHSHKLNILMPTKSNLFGSKFVSLFAACLLSTSVLGQDYGGEPAGTYIYKRDDDQGAFKDTEPRSLHPDPTKGGYEQPPASEPAPIRDESEEAMRALRKRFLGSAEPRKDVRLTIDPALQEEARQALGDLQGAIIAIDPVNGDVRALWSNPVHLAAREVFPPGSTFKVVAAAAALESGRFTPKSTFDDPVALKLPLTNRTIKNITKKPCGTTGKVDLFTALKVSCDTTFATLGLRIPGEIQNMAEAFAFNTRIPFDMSTTVSRFPTGIGDDNAPLRAYVALGQYDVAATPLHMALIAATIANHGAMVRPRVVKDVTGYAKGIIEEPPVFRQVMSRETADLLTQMMVASIQSGTGTEARIPGVKVAGKTGTAQTVPGADPHLWFIGFAPAEEPFLAVAVFVRNNHPYGFEAMGGTVAAPIAKRILEFDRQLSGW